MGAGKAQKTAVDAADNGAGAASSAAESPTVAGQTLQTGDRHVARSTDGREKDRSSGQGR